MQWIKKICKEKSTANFFAKFASKMRHMYLDRLLDAILDLGEFESCVSSILVSNLKNFADLNFGGSI